jgi:MoCo/4Fe-4S cofactor protein with predicted Tat translocation signal
MPDTPKTYWKSPQDRDGDPEFLAAQADEFSVNGAEAGAYAVSRRSFLKLSGFALASGTLAGCSQAPLKKAIPYLVQPEEVVPGRAYWYASVCGACSAGCGILAKNRDGRPIKLEGNPSHPLSRGGLCAVGQASVLELYDSHRLKAPVALGHESTWAAVDQGIAEGLARVRAAGGAVRVLTGSVTSPSLHAAIGKFVNSCANAKQVTYDPLSASAILEAHERTHRLRVLPRYRFDLADVIVGFDADFLGTWVSPVEYTEAYRIRRDPESMSWHAQFESRMSITGAKADRRVCIAPGELAGVMAAVASEVAASAGIGLSLPAVPSTAVDVALVRDVSRRLWQARGKSLVVCGRNDVDIQLIANLINHLLGAYGSTIDLQHPSGQRQGSDRELYALRDEMGSGKVAALFVHGVNPAYDIPGMAEAIQKVKLVVSLSERIDETSVLAQYICPDHHFLEAWGDSEPVVGVISIMQPVIPPLGQTRPAIESFGVWAGKSQSAYDWIRGYWKENLLHPKTASAAADASFDTLWDRALHDGHALIDVPGASVGPFDPAIVKRLPPASATSMQSPFLVLYPKLGLMDGRHAHNPWLQELPDPITKICWDNYVSVSPAMAEALKLEEGDVVRVSARNTGGGEVARELPAHIQPGQHDSVLAVALGYGRLGTDRFAAVGPDWIEARPTVTPGDTIGRNVAAFKQFDGNCAAEVVKVAAVVKTGARRDLAATQTHHTLSAPRNLAGAHAKPRPIVQEATLSAYLRDPKAGAEPAEAGKGLWPDDHPYTGMHWGMAIDLTKCTGCSACVVSCQAENNIPVVGKDEVRRLREMQWLRIDRYYAEHEGGIDVVFQPMMCQHCANAPCETVCPVLATVHSSEGLNQQVYNRCVGTRYCANNCPYKVRRFNWFGYAHEDRLQNLVLNPDVTVRSRGVMEKCSFCVQRIQEAKAEAKRRGEPVQDGDVVPACAQSCPAQAIVFGDMNDPKSAIRKMKSDPRHYQVLGELNVQPSVGYLRLIRNRQEEGGHERGHV